MPSWLETIADRIAASGAAVRVVVIRAEGSTPREAGAAMFVTQKGIDGTIGGGALELEAIAAARSILSLSQGPQPDDPAVSEVHSALWRRKTRDFPLGPSLGQCCGGYTKLLFELFTEEEIPLIASIAGDGGGPGVVVRPLDSGAPLRILRHRKDGYADLPLNVLRVTRDMLSGAKVPDANFIPGTKGSAAWFMEPLSRARCPLYLYGAGHVGRALIRVLEGLPFAVTWVDTSEDRFPPLEPPGVNRVVTSDPATAASRAEAGAIHLVMTYSHPLDLAICHAILKAGTSRFLGLIGSTTKHARFTKRLRELGHDDAAVHHLTCPIGIAGLPGKEPTTIAISVAAQLLQLAAGAKSGAIPSASEVSQ